MEHHATSASVTSEEIMEQARSFATTWSMVGGPFDNPGTDFLERAKRSEAALKRLVERLAFERDSYRAALQSAADACSPDEGIMVGFREEHYPEHLRNDAAENEGGE